MYKRVHISLSESQNYFLCELSKKWGQKKSNIIGYYLEEAAEKEGIFFDESPTDKSYLDVVKDLIPKLTYELEELRELMKTEFNQVNIDKSTELTHRLNGLQALLEYGEEK
tara:strand:+ start:172 stop:504 length:333 start_codon:yes stop_codon:yes gene_type:complete